MSTENKLVDAQEQISELNRYVGDTLDIFHL